MALGEFDLIARYFDRGPARRALLGIGDDCALIRPETPGAVLAITTDMLVCDRHFLADAPPDSVGHKALAVNLSDLAAMGARPLAFTLAIALPRVDEAWLEAFARGMFELADRSACELIGGDTTRGPLTISITALGELPAGSALRRDAGQPGDDLWVSGALGGAAFAVREALAGRPLPVGHPALERMERPQPRLALGMALRHLARAAIDVSDGLASDLGHVLARSRLGAELDWTAIPVEPCLSGMAEVDRQALALAGGDDYELLFSAAPENRVAIAALGKRLGVPLTRIGALTPGSGLRIRDARGQTLAPSSGGFDHFA